MNKEDFDKIVFDRCEKIKSVLASKSVEYSRNGDKLHNFNRGAQITGQIRERVLTGFMLKHLISIFDIINDLENEKLTSHDVIDEKIGDAINYFILLEACLKEK